MLELNILNDNEDKAEEYVQWVIKNYLPINTPTLNAVVVNNFFKSWGHKFIYDEDALKYSLELVGFRNVVKCKIHESHEPELRGLENVRRMPQGFLKLETMTFEANK